MKYFSCLALSVMLLASTFSMAYAGDGASGTTVAPTKEPAKICFYQGDSPTCLIYIL